MEPTLTTQQREELRESILRNQSSLAHEIAKLTAQGMDPEVAKALLITEVKNMRNEAFQEEVQAQKLSERRKLLFVAVMFISIIGPIVGVTSILWYFVVVAVAGICGYFGYPDKPVAGVLAAIVFSIVFPVAYSYYVEGRESIRKIEMVIPLLFALGPAALTFFILKKTVYAYQEYE